MSDKFSTVIQLGAKAPFILVMQLTASERATFIELVTPHLLEAFKRPVLG